MEAGSHERLWALLTAWSLALSTSLLVWLLLRTSWGRVLESIRDDEDVARSLGKNVFTFKLQSLTLGGVIGALGGVMLALHEQTVHAASFVPGAHPGRVGRVMRPVIGAVLFTFVVTTLDVFLTQAMAFEIIPRERIAPATRRRPRWVGADVALSVAGRARPARGCAGRKPLTQAVCRKHGIALLGVAVLAVTSWPANPPVGLRP